ncbi:hypothetical protein PHYBLDRAFT_164589 [Phycomyces blakesleeanus NRRL 1555(-)]|uniref:Uncharacterized protein n=1 Tax=Phycomyces blakesleeanus (strain ATCC 8743b / DSM 1359 / FGSC 10004 / NBRC 33097 / NRRL 1555) TaxID=763407 RepID=A0A162USX9_PHYB8|nr:hypothetical protein PHYBLDRAFT_164589 [Phycomyces blakesleeanus NRRL 1555(-)]OAD77693.1 hypothetical protein PHYBLDRAFT_164589 [Phycomyces blakesleeanus NRRL 1555(-)]|eukprot:XP_018295733.1 hypothetical protein PHYBLDRAFT_164589 [Phycomyces blakesleeanus NRRL 1555(-)]
MIFRIVYASRLAKCSFEPMVLTNRQLAIHEVYAFYRFNLKQEEHRSLGLSYKLINGAYTTYIFDSNFTKEGLEERFLENLLSSEAMVNNIDVMRTYSKIN